MTARDLQRVTLRLSKTDLRIRGTVRDTTGAPLEGALVRGLIIVEMPLTELDRGEVRAHGYGHMLSEAPKRNRATVKDVVQTTTGADGSFQLNSNVKGRLALMVRPLGDFRPVFANRPRLEHDIEDLDLTAPQGNGKIVRVLRGGRPFEGVIGFTDRTRDEHPNLTFRLNRSGEFPASALETGHAYFVFLSGNLTYRGYIAWDEPAELELTTLSKDPLSANTR